MPAQPPPLPTFIIIGAQKSATRWLRHNLGLHPEIFSVPREVKFFNHPRRYSGLGTEWYREQFRGWVGEPVSGEATPGYMMWRHEPAAVADRIRATVPDVRLLAVLRNPVDRAHSALVHHIAQERVHPRTRLVDIVRDHPPALDWLGLVSGGQYAASLEPYVDRFGDGLLVVLYDDVQADAPRVFASTLSHVGAQAAFVPPSLEDVRWSNQAGRAVAPYTSEQRAELFEPFREDVDRLERMLGRDLSAWRPEGAAVGSGPSTTAIGSRPFSPPA